jgi:hypothetical protein
MERVLLPIRVGIEESRIWAVLAIALTALSLLPIWLVKFPPLQDYPYHLLRAHIIANYSNPSFNYNETFTLSFFPVPYILVDYLLLMFNWLFSIQIAGKILLSMYVVLLPWSTFYLIRSVDKSKTVLGFFSFLLIYNWYFSMGFINFVFSIPFFLFAVGYWWRVKDRPTWKSQLLLSGLILCVYLSHLYAYVFLFCAFATLAVLSFRSVRRVLETCIPFLPLILIGGSLAYHWLQYAQGSNPKILLYPSLRKKIFLAIGKKMPYFISFSPTWETSVLFIAAGIALALLMLNIRTLKRNVSFALWLMLTLLYFLYYFISFSPAWERKILYIALAATLTLLIYNILTLKQNTFFALLLVLTLLYMLLPTLITPGYNFLAARILIFVVFIGLLVLEVPKTVFSRGVVLLILVVLSTLHLVGTLRVYQSVNQELHDYYAAIEQIPEGEPVLFRVDKQIRRVGRINPFVFFGAYYHIEKGDGTVPPIGGFIGTLRAVKYKHKLPVDHASQIKNLSRLLASSGGERVDPGGYLVVLSEGDEVVDLADRYGYKPVLTAGSIIFYQRESKVSEKFPEQEYFTVGWPDQDYDYLLLYQDVLRIDPIIVQDFEHIFSQGRAHVFRRQVPQRQSNSVETISLE